MTKELLVTLSAFGGLALAVLYLLGGIWQLVSAYQTWTRRLKGSRAHQDPHYDLPPRTFELSTPIQQFKKGKK